MKKPNGKAEAGWYDAPEIEGYLQYWNGKYWTKKKQPKDGYENLDVTPEYELGRFFFRKPYFSDNAFIGWIVVNFLMAISRLTNNVNNGELNLSSTFSIVSGLGDAVIGTLLIAFLVWIFFLAYLVPRRIKDNKEKKRK